MEKELYKIHAEMCKVFSNPTRLEILHMLRHHTLSVTELTEKTGFGQANISQHLSIMKAKGIVDSSRKGNHTYYHLTIPSIIKAFDIIREALLERVQQRRIIVER